MTKLCSVDETALQSVTQESLGDNGSEKTNSDLPNEVGEGVGAVKTARELFVRERETYFDRSLNDAEEDAFSEVESTVHLPANYQNNMYVDNKAQVQQDSDENSTEDYGNGSDAGNKKSLS